MSYQQLPQRLVFQLTFFTMLVYANITLNTTIPTRGDPLRLTCTDESAADQGFYLLNPSFQNTALTSCNAKYNYCVPRHLILNNVPIYIYGAFPFGAFIDILALNRTRDQAQWSCIVAPAGRITYKDLVIFSSPGGISIVSPLPPPTDLAETSLMIQCQTETCGYPNPTIIWYYQVVRLRTNTGQIEFNDGTTNSTNTTGSCSQPEKIYTSTLYLTRGTTFSGNIPMTAKLLCGVSHVTLNGTRFTQPSNDVLFAVSLRYVNISGATIITQGTPASFVCVTSVSRPYATVQWFIANTMVTGIQNINKTDNTGLPYVESSLAFSPDGIIHHGKEIYCQTYTITSNNAVTSTKLTLYVQVSLRYVNITGAADILHKTPATFICITSVSRPMAVVQWFIGPMELTTGIRTINKTDNGFPYLESSLTFDADGFIHDGKELYCQAYTDSANNTVTSTKLKLYVRVRVSSVTLDPPGDIITFLDGTVKSLRCNPSPSRPQPVIRWWLGGNEVTNLSSTMVTLNNTLYIASSELHLTLNRTHQDKKVYCDAQVNGQVYAVESMKPEINVWYQPSSPPIQISQVDFPWLENQTGTLQCVTDDLGNPRASVIWTSSRGIVDMDSNLVLRNLSSDDHGQPVYCQVQNNFTVIKGLTVVSPTITLNVEYVPIVTLSPSEQPLRIREGNNLTVTCTASGNPQPIVQWKNSNPLSNILHVPGILRNSTGSYTCVASSTSTNYNHVLLRREESTRVIVEYTPDVRVNISGYAVAGSTAVLMCVPKGEPPQYTFHQWIHTVGQTEIRRLDGVNTISLSTLSLSNIRIQDMGTYICTVDNSIIGLDGQINQMGDTRVYVQGLPVIIEKQSTFTGETNNSARIEIPFYSYYSIKTVKFIKQLDSFEIWNTSDISIYIQPSNITMVFYNKKVMISAHMAVLYFRNLKETDFDNYTLQLSNALGFASVQFYFIPTALPSMPNKFFFSHIEGGLLVFGMEKGFNGGSDQTFIVEYQPFGMPDATWSTIFKINENDLDDPFTNGTYYIKIPKIQDGQYIFRVYAENRKGNSSSIEGVRVEIKTELPSPVVRDVHVGAVAGGVVGGILLVIVIVVLAFVFKRWTLKSKMKENVKGVAHGSKGPEYTNTAFISEINTTEYEALQSDQTGSNQYEALNDQISKLNQSAEISISSDPIPSTGQMFYDKLQPHETNQGHMYSSLSSPGLDEGDNKIYENTVLVNKIQQ